MARGKATVFEGSHPKTLPLVKLGHVRPLDGLRGIAVLAVFGVHLYSPIFSGGGWGVDLFFVLSGFLITKLLFEEWDRLGAINLKNFYLRRLYRLQPAMFVMLLTVFIASFGIFSDVGALVRRQVFYTGLLSSNVYALFEGNAERPVLGHTWSLGLEEQFYLVWPLLLVLLPTIAFRRPDVFLRRMALVVLASIVIGRVVVLGLLDYPHWGSIPFFNIDGLAFGCMLAIYMHTSSRTVSRLSPVVLGTCVAVVGADLIFADRYMELDSWHLRVVVLRLIFTYFVFVVVTSPTSPAVTWLNNRVLTYFGAISYSLYLWHIPVFGVFDDERNPGADRVVLFVAKIVVSIGVAAASYHLVERPIVARYRRRKSVRDEATLSSTLSPASGGAAAQS